MALYAGTFLISLATLALEITLTRLLSLTTWYHLAFFALSTAMLGMTAGAVRVYLGPERFSRERWRHEAAGACLGFALITPCSLTLLCLMPAGMTLSTMGIASLLATTVACSAPFYCFGIAITLALTRSGLPIGRIYGSDLVGAALGCVFVLAALGVRGAPSVTLWCAAIGGLAALCFGSDRARSFRGGSALLVALLVAAGAGSVYGRWGVYPVVRKSLVELPSEVVPSASREAAQQFWTLVDLEKWNALSRVSVSPERLRPPALWAASPKLPPQLLPQRELHIDGGASTTLRRFSSPADLDHLRYDVVNVPYALRPNGGAAIIGVGGGKDVQSAILFGHDRIVAIDVNPSIIELLNHDFRSFVGIADHPGVTLVTDDARSWLTRTAERFSLIQMSLIDSWAATQAGAFTLSENALYTVEAWEVFLDRLTPGGVFTVSRMFNPKNLSETGRMLSLGVAALERRGVSTPAAQLALVAHLNTATLMVSNEPFSSADVATLLRTCAELEFLPVVVPGTPCPIDDLRRMVDTSSVDELLAVTRGMPLNLDPPTDENPYFFNLLRLGQIRAGYEYDEGVLAGNTMATFVLMSLIASLLVVALVTIVVPLLLRRRLPAADRVGSLALAGGAAYFSAIGAGFMFTEVALIQRLSVFLGHPTYALGVLLFTMILSAGAGSMLSSRLPVVRPPFVLGCAAIAAVALWQLDRASLFVLRELISGQLPARIAASIALVAPFGLLLGLFFPSGMRLAERAGAGDTPWFWALNGVFGVLASASAVFVSLYLGISTNFLIAAACYASLLASAGALLLAGPRAAGSS